MALQPTPLRLLQNRNLPRMIQLMLRNPMQHVIEIVPFSRHPIAQPRVRQVLPPSSPACRASRFVSATALRHAASVGLTPEENSSSRSAGTSFPPAESTPLDPTPQHAAPAPRCCGHSASAWPPPLPRRYLPAAPALTARATRSHKTRAAADRRCPLASVIPPAFDLHRSITSLRCTMAISACIRRIHNLLSIQQQALSRIHRETRRPRRLHHLDRLHADHRHIEAHILIRLRDLHHCQRSAQSRSISVQRTHDLPGALDRGVRSFHGLDRNARRFRNHDRLPDIVPAPVAARPRVRNRCSCVPARSVRARVSTPGFTSSGSSSRWSSPA